MGGVCLRCLRNSGELKRAHWVYTIEKLVRSCEKQLLVTNCKTSLPCLEVLVAKSNVGRFWSCTGAAPLGGESRLSKRGNCDPLELVHSGTQSGGNAFGRNRKAHTTAAEGTDPGGGRSRFRAGPDRPDQIGRSPARGGARQPCRLHIPI